MASPAAWTQPSEHLIRAADLALRPWRAWTSPVFHGLENLPESGPALLVGNHTLYGVVDAPLIFFEIHRRRGVWVRSLADHAHWRIPGWRRVMDLGGSVDGTRDNCRALLNEGHMVVVFPGGAREATRARHECYQLQWERRLGFARLAVEAGCPIVPFGSVGAEEMFTTVLDSDSRLLAPARALTRSVLGDRARGRDDIMMPLSRGIGPTLVPRPERLYFRFGTPIDTAPWKGREQDDLAVTEVRDLARKSVQEIIDGLREEQAADRGRTPLRRLSRTITRTARALPAVR
ncbi:lysophospholipid acyltransferase family protein [Actinomadura rupiterrae]|uniref:lysophospholipid acyltransferase family protein n=1 Tax=Actinomadura rupiterrae TaxID=559627 RepID=UPI0020A4379B|nr:lysophospholipid acyltransferase family protein [Actinomadura rupiterrae]MCP2339672.1 1-acyl-sn-glycerol-3-phosphate acyltransferase [Actinomadura rupiterrae]